jgi:peptidoglycan/LPS O-acetylase OafA/YrhL
MDATTQQPARLTHVAALDGLRGVAVLAVLAFHSHFSWATGGFLGVSLFFTLSGFLITSLLLAERTATGRLRLRDFWARRARRLLPGALLCLGAVGLAGSLGVYAPGTDVRDGLIASLAYVANWHAISGHTSYATLFTSPSPLEHFWSLAIEEQFYLVFPLLALLSLGRGRRVANGTRRLGLVALVLWTTGTLLALFAPWSTNVVYYSTLTRMPELAAGILLAIVLFDPRTRTWRRPSGRGTTLVATTATLVTVLAFAFVTVGDPNVERGGLALFSILSACVLVGALQGGWLSRALSWPPLVALGAISYGVYLAHWPIFVALPQGRLGLHGLGWHAVQLVLTFAAAIASYRLLERPIRRRQLVIGTRRVLVPALAAVTIVALGSLPPVASTRVVTIANAEDAFTAATQPEADVGPTTPPAPRPSAGATSRISAGSATVPRVPFPALPSGRALNVALFGDSTAAFLGLGFGRWSSKHQTQVRMIGGVSRIGCGLSRDGYDVGPDAPGDVAKDCPDWHPLWQSFLAHHHVDVAVISTGFNESGLRMLPGRTQWSHLGDPAVDQQIVSELQEAQALFDSEGVPTVWLTMPTIKFVNELLPDVQFDQNTPGRMALWNALLESTAAAIPTMRVLPFGEWLDSQPEFAPGAPGRPDGLHLSPAGASTATEEWLFPQIQAQFSAS